MSHEVFISYSSKDQKIAEGLLAFLEQKNIRCFIAYRDIPRGVPFAKAITEAIESSKLMVVVFSKHFDRSEHVDREIEICLEDGKPILTFRIEDVAFTGAKRYYLKNINWIDAFPKPVNFFGELYEDILKLLPEINLNNETYSTKTIIERFNDYCEISTAELLKKPFLMPIEDVFNIDGVTVITGRIETGIVKYGDKVQLTGLYAGNKEIIIDGVELSRKIIDEGEAGENVGLLLRGVNETDVKRGMVVTHIGEATSHTKFKAEIFLMNEEDGGSKEVYKYQHQFLFYFRTVDVLGNILLPPNNMTVKGGDIFFSTIELTLPVACSLGFFFGIVEDDHIIGIGQIIELLN